jgi:hypothetical protein
MKGRGKEMKADIMAWLKHPHHAEKVIFAWQICKGPDGPHSGGRR